MFTEIASGYRDARVHAQRLVADLLPVRRLPLRHRDVRRARRRAACSSRTARSRSATSSPSCCTSTCSSRRSSSCRRCSTRTSRRASRSSASASCSRHADDGPAAGASRSIPAASQGDVALDAVHFSYSTAIDEALRGVDLARRAGRDRRARRRDRGGQEHGHEARRPLLRPDVGRGARRRCRGRRLRPGRVPPAARRRAAGGVPLLGHDPRQHRLRPQGRRPTPRSRPRRARSARTTSSRRCPAVTSSG